MRIIRRGYAAGETLQAVALSTHPKTRLDTLGGAGPAPNQRTGHHLPNRVAKARTRARARRSKRRTAARRRRNRLDIGCGVAAARLGAIRQVMIRRRKRRAAATAEAARQQIIYLITSVGSEERAEAATCSSRTVLALRNRQQ